VQQWALSHPGQQSQVIADLLFEPGCNLDYGKALMKTAVNVLLTSTSSELMTTTHAMTLLPKQGGWMDALPARPQWQELINAWRTWVRKFRNDQYAEQNNMLSRIHIHHDLTHVGECSMSYGGGMVCAIFISFPFEAEQKEGKTLVQVLNSQIGYCYKQELLRIRIEMLMQSTPFGGMQWSRDELLHVLLHASKYVESFPAGVKIGVEWLYTYMQLNRDDAEVWEDSGSSLTSAFNLGDVNEEFFVYEETKDMLPDVLQKALELLALIIHQRVGICDADCSPCCAVLEVGHALYEAGARLDLEPEQTMDNEQDV